ncbi:replication initiation protein [Francisella sp. XLW-1]|uniref:replication initiation protein n=1 Tax=Francisella sp. XLW-1 TaxID=2610887 RepID=UPI00123DC086|nr:replication initiation protein [Francisella sp. XLW-1]
MNKTNIDNNILKKSFYLTSLFADIKSEHNWTTNETKLVLMLLSRLNEYKIYLPDFDNFTGNIKEYRELVSKVPTDYVFNKIDFEKITGVRREHLAREINKVRKSLGSKIINTPHPIESEDVLSGRTIPWFSEITYSNRTGDILISLNTKAIERLIAFVKYSNISFDNIVKIQNHNAIYSYLIFKILRDSSNQKHLSLDITEYKNKLGLGSKYRSFSTFKKQVLEVVREEINEYTDLYMDFELVKEAKSFKSIKFSFDYKQDNIKDSSLTKKQKNINNEYLVDFDYKKIKSPFEKIFKSWGISNNKIEEIEDAYTLSAISSSIQVTQQAIIDDIIETTPARYFLGTLENKNLQEEVAFEKEQENLRKEQEKNERKALASEYDAIQKFINDNADIVSNFLSVKSAGGSIELSSEIYNEFANIACIDAEKYKNFRPKLPVLVEGFFDMRQKKEIRPNMYVFLTLIKEYS